MHDLASLASRQGLVRGVCMNWLAWLAVWVVSQQNSPTRLTSSSLYLALNVNWSDGQMVCSMSGVFSVPVIRLCILLQDHHEL